jgi:hypothetical protein
MLANQVLSGVDRVDLKRFSADVAETAAAIRNHIEKKDKKDRTLAVQSIFSIVSNGMSSARATRDSEVLAFSGMVTLFGSSLLRYA